MSFDTHIHTQFSSDSRMTIQEALAAAEASKVGMIITEHMDLEYPEAGKFVFDVTSYFECYQQYRSDKLLLGIEIGMREDCVSRNSSLINLYSFDYVIGSVHIVDDIDIYCKQYYRNRSKQDAYQRYFDTMLKCIECHNFIDSLGHIDYICRYAPYDEPEIGYKDFKEGIDPVLSVVVERGMSLEVNTRRLDNKGTVENLAAICRRFYELGGRLATVGSDAHRTEDIGRRLAIGWDIAEQAGLKVVYYKERQPVFDTRGGKGSVGDISK